MANGIVNERAVPIHKQDLEKALQTLLGTATSEVEYKRAELLLSELEAADRRCRLDTHDLFITLTFKEHAS
jgi:hypothetical protein